jgi:hypothetical protein
MTYVSGFEHDVFISYAHNDNTVDGSKPRWVKSFADQLSAKLLKQCGEAVDVWWDDSDLDRSQVFDEVIRTAVKGSAVMLCLLSPSYVKRDYCLQELDWFAESGELKTAGGYLRIFAIQLFRLPFDQWPAKCQGTSGFEFFDPRFDRLSRPLDVTSDQFTDGQWKLVSELAVVLDELRQLRAAPKTRDAVQAAAGRSGAFTVFLASSTDEMTPDRTFLKKQLQNNGIEVISKIPPPYEEDAHAAAVMKAVDEADLCVHLLGDSPGAPFDEDAPDRTFPVAQATIALERAKSQIILLPESLAPDLIQPGAYADFVRDIQSRDRQISRLQIIRAGRQQFVEEILAARQKLEEQAAAAIAAKAGAPRTAFVDLHLKDLAYVSDLIAYLAKKNITAITVPSAEQSPVAGMAMFEQHLKTAQLFIVVFGQVARTWVVNRVAEAFKLIVANGFSTRMGIYVAPPEKPPQDIQFGFCDVMLNAKKFDPASIDRLLANAWGAVA